MNKEIKRKIELAKELASLSLRYKNEMVCAEKAGVSEREKETITNNFMTLKKMVLIKHDAEKTLDEVAIASERIERSLNKINKDINLFIGGRKQC